MTWKWRQKWRQNIKIVILMSCLSLVVFTEIPVGYARNRFPFGLHKNVQFSKYFYSKFICILCSFPFKFCVKIFTMSGFAKPLMDLIHVWHGNIYWSKILALPSLLQYMTLRSRSFLILKFLQRPWWIWSMFVMVIDTGSKFYMEPSPSQYTLRSRSQT